MFDNVDPNDPDRNLKKIGKLVGVSNQILRLAIKNRESIQTETSEEREERILVKKIFALQKFLINFLH